MAGAGFSRSSTPAIAPPEMINDDMMASFDEDPEEQDFDNDVVEPLSIRESNMELIERVLRKHGGNRKAAAAELGISERTLYRKIKK